MSSSTPAMPETSAGGLVQRTRPLIMVDDIDRGLWRYQ